MVSVERFSPTGLARPIGAFNHVAVHPVGRVAHLSGQIGSGPDGVVPPDAEEQTALAFANIETLLRELGVGPGAIVKLLTFVVGEDSFAAFAAARSRVFARWFPEGDLPAHSAAVVPALARPDLLVEIEGVVYLGP